MRVIFMGTPEFAVPTLKALIEEKYDVVAVVTQPDKPIGRKQIITPPPVKVVAIENNINVIQPVTVKTQEFIDSIKSLAPDIVVTCAYGKILTQDFLNIPRLGTVNVHSSLLPKYRGAAPINWAIINGEKNSGVTTMFTDVGMDTGDIINQNEVAITDEMTAEQLHDLLKVTGANLLIQTLNEIKNGEVVRVKQDESKASYAPMLNKETGKVDWNKSAAEISCLVRGTTPWPGSFSYYKDTRFKLCKIKKADLNTIDKVIKLDDLQNGEVFLVNEDGIFVRAGAGAVVLEQVHPDSGKVMSGQSFANGREIKPGEKFGN